MSDWARLRTALEAAIDVPEAELGGVLAEHCGDDLELRAEVLRILAHDTPLDPLLDAAPAAFAPALDSAIGELAAGTQLGPWIVRDAIASGGMGTVYRGERADGKFEKTVAIKLVKAGMDSVEVLARFENEQRVLAELEHPGIARLLDAGTSDRGRPYFVMEYVDGTPIDVFAEQRGLGECDRIELLAAVCDAVHVAHQALVVHRDLKPSNVLVTAEGLPKLLDFGIAKVLGPEQKADAARTLGPSRVMTPEYASPEQLRGEIVATASDVYSLGLLLTDLFGRRRSEKSGHRPGAQLARDLGTIAEKALHDEPSRRYASAAQLGEDLRRYLADLPVMARPDVWSYRASRFIRRHRALVAAATAVLLALAAGLISTWSQYRRAAVATVRAEERFEDVSELAQSFLFELDDLLEDVEGATPARDFVVSKGLEYLDALAEDDTADEPLRRRVVQGYLKMGDLLGGPLVPNLGRAEAALASYERALSKSEELGADVAADLLVLCHHRIGVLREHAGELRGARDSFARALEIGAEATGELKEAAVFEALLHVQDSLVTSSQRQGDFVGALAEAQELSRLVRVFSDRLPQDRRRQLEAMSTTRLGIAQGLAGRPRAAERSLRAATRVARSWHTDDPTRASAEGVLTFCLFNLAAHLQTLGALEECVEILDECTAIHRRQRASDPANVQAAHDLAACLNVLSYVLPALGRFEEALASASEHLDVARERSASDPTDRVARRNVAAALLARTRALSLLGRHSAARVACLEAQATFIELASSASDDAEAGPDVAVAADELGRLHKRWAETLEDATLELQHRRAALAAFQEHLRVLTRQRAEGRLWPSDEPWIEAGEENVRQAEAAIAALVAATEG